MTQHGEIITAPDDDIDPDELENPLIYLNGPIQGCADWQSEAISILDVIAPELHIASPRAKKFIGGAERHRLWEQAFLERASVNGVVLFWLCPETKHRCNRSFAAQTRFELGEWAVRAQIGLCKLVVGFEQGFYGKTYLLRRFATEFTRVPVCRSLLQTCTVAAEMARSDNEIPITIYPRELSELFSPRGLFKPS